MNTWNDFKACQPKTNWPINPVFVTDGEKVWFGRLSIWRRSLMFTGCSLQSGELEQFHADKLTGWQTAPNTFVPERSADEMFKEIGYSKLDGYSNEIWYRKKVNDYSITLITDFDTKTVDCKTGRSTVPMEFAEILACAQLIREMEESKNE